jgi:diguanylate cyclase (GGDEF)-like protein
VLLLDGLLTDVTDRKGAEARLQHLADHDALTGLLNRRRFLEELELELAVVRRGMRSSAAIVLDVDGFKFVNDSLGHQAGDELIRTVAAQLSSRLRASDAVARLGGDEFACLLRGTAPKEAEEVAGQLLAALRETRLGAAGESAVRVTASAGVAALGDGEQEGAEAVLSAADLAMYEGKRAGRDRVVRFTPRLRAELERGRSWLARLHDALENDRFQLFAQPVMDLRTRGVVQHELLLRLPGEEGELVGPDAFLPVAERFELLEAIDRWVLERALAMLRSPATEGLAFEVNLSARSIGGGMVGELLERELAGHAFDPSRLIVEITETAAIANMADARALSEQLSRLGVRMALDDFGSGLGSFYYLKHLPVDYLKIDGEFIRALTTSPVDQEVVKAIVMLARAVGRRTIAEFVPDASTLRLLAEYGVDLAQGFHIGHPRPVESLW